MPNRLAESSSPYLRQHQNNPVDWFPWCEAAFAKAKTEDKPIFLSVGYSACHWCHVMEHESFENTDIAEILNQNFVSIKVDREERPDVDQIYMQAVQMLTGSGGWPMSVFMCHDGKPFFGGTYWPPDSRWGRPGFGQVLLAVLDAWTNKKQQILEQSSYLTQKLEAACLGPAGTESGLSEEWIQAADRWLKSNHDSRHGGFGQAPKFPHAMDLMLLIELSARGADETRDQVVQTTLNKMAQGGIYDHLGGGFARYSVDDRWLVPHFEKMLYDNALLACAYADAYRLWKTETYAEVVRETLDYVIRDMTNPQGGYYSTEDADSEGIEGKFYVWTPAEIHDVLGPQRGEQFCACYDVSDSGNFEGANILNLPKSIEQFAGLRNLNDALLKEQLAEDRARLLQRRSERVRPGLDDKVLLSWNALMITAMVRGFRALGDPKYLKSARRALDFLVQNLRRDDGQFWHTWREGKPSLNAYLDDYAYLVDALVELFQVDALPETLSMAIELSELILDKYADPSGGFFFTANDHETLIARSKDMADSSVPSGNAMAASGLLTLYRLTGREHLRQAAESALSAASGVMSRSPQAAGQSLRVLARMLRPSQEFVLLQKNASEPYPSQASPKIGTTEPTDSEESYSSMALKLLNHFEPGSITVLCPATRSEQLNQDCPLLQGRELLGGESTLYVCQDSVCRQPVSGAQAADFVAALA